MIHLPHSINAWNTPEFDTVFKRELEELDINQLPVQECLMQSAYALSHGIQTMIINSAEVDDSIQVKAGLFFKGIIPGCSCADDPTPENEYEEYGEILITINRQTGKATISCPPD